ncbi:lysophospholipid acyltransferase family protein [Roseimaritima ulvae]|uniref:Phospholipid/glycerol acyltransferase domain-containing protein n=1 Tax=Roseimaritima ulvae TaxID=980254 RepID=A0A5B9R1N1_9BACT|nr:lysophospholipid acyltransferase family protein [Roseimaritima ulvae]QEG40111.1 hypothetical protein UC8_21160 [Roseimaritima ulvae]
MSTVNPDLPVVSSFLQNGFHRYLKGLLRRNFHTVAVAEDSLSAADVPPDQPLIVFANHPGWWDPLVAHWVCRHVLKNRQFYAPIDAIALQQYRVLGKLGFYGVRSDTTAGIAAFLKTSRAILNTPGSSIWITPTGRFADPRETDVEFAHGLGHLCSRIDRGTLLPLAMEYSFWEERLPECLLRFGQPILIEQHPLRDKAAWTEYLFERLRETQQNLAELVIARDAAAFRPVLHGGKGAGRVYDLFRRLRSWWSGRELSAQHGKKFS